LYVAIQENAQLTSVFGLGYLDISFPQTCSWKR